LEELLDMFLQKSNLLYIWFMANMYKIKKIPKISEVISIIINNTEKFGSNKDNMVIKLRKLKAYIQNLPDFIDDDYT